jgi:hypothetical protein
MRLRIISVFPSIEYSWFESVKTDEMGEQSCKIERFFPKNGSVTVRYNCKKSWGEERNMSEIQRSREVTQKQQRQCRHLAVADWLDVECAKRNWAFWSNITKWESSPLDGVNLRDRTGIIEAIYQITSGLVQTFWCLANMGQQFKFDIWWEPNTDSIIEIFR